jgi:two-component system response regulator AtoC
MLLHILIATEELELNSKLRDFLTRKDTVVESLEEPGAFWKDLGQQACDMILVSRALVTNQALDRIRDLRTSSDTPGVVVLTEFEDEKDRAELVAAGCEAVLNVDLPFTKLGQALRAIVERKGKAAADVVSIPLQQPSAQITDFVAESDAMKRFLKPLPRIAESSSSILILGETGVGKERLAHVLHAESPRSGGPFVAVHCGALPESLLESELFGHEQGAFTGATKARRGCFEMAHQGTLFLDEIGEMPLHLQSKLLRVLESKEIRRVGGEKLITVDVRVLAATNRDLEEEVGAGQFRRDLYYRLNVVSLTMPTLRERTEDIPDLIDSYVEHLGSRIGCAVSGVSEGALEALRAYSWPGNVRELINVLERAMLLCENDLITPDDLPAAISGHEGLPIRELSRNPEVFPEELAEKPLKEARTEVLEQFEKGYLTRVLTVAKGRVGEAAKRAGIDTRTLFDKMKHYGLDKKDFKA